MFDRKSIGLTVSGLLAGFFLGGLIFGKSPQTTTKTVAVERTVEIEKVVTVQVERTVIVKEYLKADKQIITEHKASDGTITIVTENFGLGVTKEQTTNEQISLGVSEKTKQSEAFKSATTVTKLDTFEIGGGFFISPSNPLAFDYKRNWYASFGYRLWQSPFKANIVASPSFIGLGLSFTF